MYSVESLHDIPDNHTVDFITPEISGDPSYFFRKIYLPAAIIRLAQGENFAGEGEIHMTGKGSNGYHEARDYYHSSPNLDQTLRSLQGRPNDRHGEPTDLESLVGNLPNIAQVIGLRVDPDQITDHYHGKYYTIHSGNVPTIAVDPNSRLGLYKLLGKPAKLEWFVKDVDPSIETEFQLRNMG